MMTRRHVVVLPLAAFMAATQAQEIDRTSPLVEAIKKITLQDQITTDVQTIYNRHPGVGTEVQAAIEAEVTAKLDEYVRNRLVERFTVVCDARNNPQGVIDTGKTMLFVFYRAVDSVPGIYNRIFIGPDDAVQHILNKP